MGPFPFDDELLALCDAGKVVSAIKLCRAEAGCSLYDAKTYVETLRDRRPTPAPAFSIFSDLDHRLSTLWRGGNRVGAIKLYRKEADSGLKEALDYCKALDERVDRAGGLLPAAVVTSPEPSRLDAHPHYGNW